MTQDEIIEMARQAGLVEWHESIQQESYTFAMPERLEAFAKLVAQHEREACANVCENLVLASNGGMRAAIVIRARGQA